MLLRKRLGLAVNKIVHCDDVMFRVIIRPGGNVARSDSHTGNPRIAKYDTEERLAPIAWRGWHRTAEQELAVDTEKLYQRAGSAV
jgi:hypothetical protein